MYACLIYTSMYYLIISNLDFVFQSIISFDPGEGSSIILYNKHSTIPTIQYIELSVFIFLSFSWRCPYCNRFKLNYPATGISISSSM